jgi:tRNA modification GTPase
MPFSFVDTAGLRDEGVGEVEAIGIARAQAELGRADLVLWLGPEGEGPRGAWEIEAQVDRAAHSPKTAPQARVSALTAEGIAELKQALVTHAMRSMPKPGEGVLNARQRGLIGDAATALEGVRGEHDPLLLAEHLRLARVAFDSLTGRAATEDLLDTLFGRFCIGK